MRKLSEQYDKYLHLIIDPLSLEKLMKLIIFSAIKQSSKSEKQKIIGLLDELTFKFTQDNYIHGYEYLRQGIAK
jgi:hypothetical protein